MSAAIGIEEVDSRLGWLLPALIDLHQLLAPACAGRDEYGTPSAQVDNSAHSVDGFSRGDEKTFAYPSGEGVRP